MTARALAAIIFDLDGTIMDRQEALRGALSAQYERNLPHFAGVDREAFIAAYMELDNRGYSAKRENYNALLERWPAIGLSSEELTVDYEANFFRSAVYFPGAEAALVTLRERGYRLGVITNGHAENQGGKMRMMALERYVDTVLISGAEGVKKPDPEIFWRAATRLGADPSDCLYVGDYPVNDIAGALGAGMRAIWKRDDFWAEPEGHCGILEDWASFPDLIAKLG